MKNCFLRDIVYALHKFGFCYYSIKYYWEDNFNKNIFNNIMVLFCGIFNGLKIFNYKFGYFEYLEIPITTKCSLRCQGCSNLIPCYKDPKDVDIDVLEKSIDVFLKCINNIVYVRILGGEPFVSKNLILVIDKLLDSNKIQRIEIVTNGTIVPKDKKLLKILTNSRIIVSISNYPNVDNTNFINILQKWNINYKIDDMDFWMDYGGLNKRNKSIKELKKQYKKCRSVCKSLLNGQLHLCPRSSHGTDLGIVKNNSNDYVDLLNNDISIEEKKKEIINLLKKDYILACDYCDFATSNSKKIGVADQLK